MALKLGPGEEANLEDKFIRPVLRALGYEWDVQPRSERGVRKRRPDYALFKDKTSHETARAEKADLTRFFRHPVTILEAKYWGRRLNDTDTEDKLDRRDPTAQTVKYLDDVYHASEGRIQWAILTNGKQWRLFYYRAASRSGNFFEIDLEEIIVRGNIEDFLYFHLFFSRDAFVKDPATDRAWLDRHLKGSEEYAARVSARLKELIFDEVFERLAEGFVHYRRTELSIAKETEESKKEIFKGCLTLLYRLLFLLYAESRSLLPIEEDGYNRVSLKKLKEDTYSDLTTIGLDKMGKRSYGYWARLTSLFDIIAKGDPALNVPVYNGGLFETSGESFLSVNKMPDPFLAAAVEKLTVDHSDDYRPGATPFIDYSSLNVRHLGDIYEGLLEFHVQIADEEIFEVKEKGKPLWKKASEIKKDTKTYREKAKDEVYIENSKHERKATGSYYTPHYVVEYIVKNTVGPVLEERLKSASDLLAALEDASKTLRKQRSTDNIRGEKARVQGLEASIFHAIFDVKVLDPAMGSGHFLVHGVDFISDRIITFLADYPDNPVIQRIHALRAEMLDEIKRQGVRIDEGKLTEVNLIKRMVMKRCIYGVDLNDMAVELAKLSLWLDSFTLGAPLSFLDHHLKCGDSLIGVLDISDVAAPGSEAFGKMQRALSYMLQVAELTDATISEAQKSYEFFKKGYDAIEPIRRRFDVATSKYFMPLNNNIGRLEHLAYTLEFDKEPYPEIVEKCKQALRFAREKKFFHWRLEFPEVFYMEKGEKDNPGFDCVIGNPPYGILSKEMFFKNAYVFIHPNWDIYVAFIERGLSFVKNGKFLSYIAPVSWETGAMFERMREILLTQTCFRRIVNLPFDVFRDAYIDTGVFVIEKTERSVNTALVYEFPKKNRVEKLDDIEYLDVAQNNWLKNKNQIILNPNAISIISRLSLNSIKLEDITTSIRGVLARPEFISSAKKSGHYQFFDSEMSRYEISPPDKFILYSDALLERPADINFFKGQRIFVRRLISRQDRLMATCVQDFFITKKDIYIFKINNMEYSPHYVLAALNSKVLSFIYLSQETISKKDDFRQTTLTGIRTLAIPRISFTTPESKRKKSVSEAIKLYHSDMETGPIKWVEAELSAGRNDTVHDFLAYLAERMIEMNKAKNKEIRDFLKWLEREIGTEIESLSNKTAIREYYGHDFNYLLDTLKQNKKKISIDPSDRKAQELLEKHFSKSISVLAPLNETIKATDKLIDETVYRLYGLSEDEIRIVKGQAVFSG